MSQHDRYISPFSTRYASDEMQYIFSDDNKFRTWRRLWVALARAEMDQGLTNITPDMVAELEAHVDDINYEVAIEREKLVRHDVMSHVYAYGQQCPKAAGIIHLGATSCYVGDNTDIIVMRQGLELVRKKLVGVLAKLAHFAKEYKDMPCMAYTHCQPAQPTTVGKRATLWANELVMDLAEIDHRLATLQLRGVKGTTGTQASFMELFKGDADKIRAVDASIAKEMGFDPKAVVPVSGQTYSRKVDAFILNALAGIGQSCMKFATDLRLLANFKEMEEPFEKNQIGSSAMPYKRNPMRCERICALARYLMVDVLNPSFTTGTQWFERTLDDSANKRVAMAEGFLATDAILNIMLNVTDGLVVYPKVVRSRLMAELPFMASENIMMKAVKKGEKGDPGRDAPQEAVLYTAQTLNDAQKTQARENIGAADEETVNQLKDDKVNQSDALTLEEIMASTDLSKKVASAEAVKSIKNAIGSIKSGSFYAEKSKGNTVPVDYGGFIRLSGGSWPGSFYSDTYYVGVGAGSEAFLGVQINGAKQITWVKI